MKTKRYFEGTLRGSAGEVTRLATQEDGLVAITATEKGGIRVRAYYNKNTGQYMAQILHIQWQGQGKEGTIYHGPIGL